jgi:hypothetical protein
MASSDKWISEGDVILEMRGLSLSETKVSIHSEVMAGIVFDSRPAVCDVSQLIRAQARNFEKALTRNLHLIWQKSNTMRRGKFSKLEGFLRRRLKNVMARVENWIAVSKLVQSLEMVMIALRLWNLRSRNRTQR